MYCNIQYATGDVDRYLPVDQLGTIMRDMVVGLLRHDTSIFMRGNLYAALLNHLHLTRLSPSATLTLDMDSDEAMVYIIYITLSYHM